ncbi:MAG TPA: hypothetical protein VEW26_05730, partial [Allosphingosinicella sp.]|nr:hypothetical protein [Allosphingosinicella sp.]
MADFDQSKTKLGAARGAVLDKERALDAARLALARAKTERSEAERRGGADALAEADGAVKAREASLGKARKELDGARGKLSGAFEGFAGFTDPRQRIAELSDATPILLLPLRIETRFKPKDGQSGTTAGGQLWVRVYPDDIAVDAFEDNLSESEISRTEAYW